MTSLPSFDLSLAGLARKRLWQEKVRYVTFNSIPPAYAPPRPPPTGKPLTNRKKIALGATIMFVFLLFIVVLLLRRHLG